MNPRTGAPRANAQPVRHDGGRHRQPKAINQGGTAPGKTGMKLAAGLLGTAALAVPGAMTWALPSSIAMTHLNPKAYTARDLTGPQAQFRVFKYGNPVLRSASGSQSHRSAAQASSPRGKLTQPAQSKVRGQKQTAGRPAAATFTAFRSVAGAGGQAASAPAHRFADPGAPVVVRPDGTVMPLTGASAFMVPPGSLLMVPGATVTSGGAQHSPYGVITMPSNTGSTGTTTPAPTAQATNATLT